MNKLTLQSFVKGPRLPLENSEFWNDKAEGIKAKILQDDPEKFLTWPDITSTMFVGNAKYIEPELEYLRSNGWQRWEKAVQDPGFGAPESLDLLPGSSGNYIHQAYHLAQFESATGRKIESFGKIIEIGPGYGALPVIARQIGFAGHYVLYDQPILSYLQRYYLDNILGNDGGIHFCNDMEKLERYIEGTDLLIANYSLSELTLKHRDLLVQKLQGIPYILITHQPLHDDIDNTRWFDGLMKLWDRYHWQIIPTAVSRAHRYLIGDTVLSSYQSVYTTGYPRSGNTWLNRLLGDILEAPLQTLPGEIVQHWGELNDSRFVIRKRHSIHQQPGPTVFIYRDPRDVAVSAMYFRIATNLEEVIDTMLYKPISEDQLGAQEGNYAGWIRSWWGSDREFAAISYEQLQTDPIPNLQRVVRELTGEEISAEKIARAIERQEFERVLGAHPEYFHSMRKGISGDWINYFTRDLGALFHEHLGELMREQGYIDSDDWFEDLPEEPLIHYDKSTVRTE